VLTGGLKSGCHCTLFAVIKRHCQSASIGGAYTHTSYLSPPFPFLRL
jgi:hypothetical protein